MAHELEIREDGTASLFSGEGLTPWHGLGQVVEGLKTADEALTLAGLDWEVEKQPVFVKVGGEDVEVKDRFATVRSTDGKPLGIVGSDYKIHSNRQAFSLMDSIVDSGDAKYTTAGSLFGGSRVFMTAKIGETMTVCGEDTDMYLMITNSHDGSRAFTAATTMIRAVCNNTVTMGLNSAKTKWSLRHRSTLEGRTQEARDALQLAFKNAEAFEDEVKKLMDVQVDADTFKRLVADVPPDQKLQKEKNLTQLMTIFESEPTIIDTEAEGNAWGAFNAFTFWTDHVKASRNGEARMNSLLDGFASRGRNQLHERLLALS